MNNPLIRAVWVGLGLVLSANAAAGKDFRLATNLWPPFVEVNGDGTLQGLAIEKIERAAKEAGMLPLIEAMPYLRMVRSIAEKRYDGAFLLSRNPKREAIYHFSPPLFCERRYIYAKRKLTGDGVGNNIRRTIGVIKGVQYGHRFDDLKTKGVFKTAESLTPSFLFKMLKHGRVEAILFSEREADTLLTNGQYDGTAIYEAPEPFTAVELHLVVPKETMGQDTFKKLTDSMQILGATEYCDRK